jgi:hypothetical protein
MKGLLLLLLLRPQWLLCLQEAAQHHRPETGGCAKI